MDDFLGIALSFPTIIFSFGLILVALYWLLAVVGAMDIDVVDIDKDAEADGASGLGALGFGEVPLTVILSLWITVGWVISIASTMWLQSLVAGTSGVIVSIAIFIAALGIGIFVTKVLSAPLKRVFADAPVQTRSDFVGKVCVVQTQSITGDYGQAELTSADGSSAIVQVRRSAHEPGSFDEDQFSRGSKLVIFDYDESGEVFLAVPFETHHS
ncbi:OB-fold-containig protein [Natronoglycomyces albus]|uniref:DUF1449 family protein n=1 Tax=Natronoglycomyces albus TaxID=2811108 RepID=A0A895XH92_9ACTN|nr:OB-fold-containig protein [Natronoglycomyces albus]QSB05211.1 DUF1449 family protein [Natronoglycomyces albus]